MTQLVEIVKIFLPKVIILTLAVFVISNETMLELFERKETDRESIEDAYVRFCEGQYGVDFDSNELGPASPEFA